MFKVFYGAAKVNRENIDKDGNLFYYCAGEIFEPDDMTMTDLYQLLRDKQKLPNLIGEFNLYIEDDENIYIVSDEVGTISWYYSIEKNNFYLSNSLWSIAAELNVSTDDIDKDAIYEEVILMKALGNKTILKNIKTIPRGSVCTYSKRNKTFDIVQHSKIVYNPDESLKKEQCFEIVDFLFKKTINKLRYYNKSSKIAITISGGLDSRFPLPYIDAEDTDISYLIGKKNGLLSPYDYRMAKKMANIYNLKFKMIDPFETKYENKKILDLSRNPTTNNNILKAIDKSDIFKDNKFDVLITGAYGGLIGGRVLSDHILKPMNEKFFYSHMFFSYSTMGTLEMYRINKKGTSYFSKLNKLVRFLVQDSKSSPSSKCVHNEVILFLNNDFLLSSSIKENIFQKFKNYIDTTEGNRLTKIMNYHLRIHGIRGGFESLHGQVKSYSIYHPFIYEFSKTWPIDFLKNRMFMEDFLYYKFPELAKIPLQSYGLSITDKKNKTKFQKFFKKILILFSFKIRGLSINYTNWAKNEKFRDDMYNTNEDSYFYRLFNKDDVKKILNDSRHSHLKESLMKTKLLIEMIETQEYKTILDKDKFEFSSKY